MSLNIENPEAQALAARLATKTGETLTRAVTQALRERLARRDEVADFDEDRYRRLLAIGADCRARLKPLLFKGDDFMRTDIAAR